MLFFCGRARPRGPTSSLRAQITSGPAHRPRSSQHSCCPNLADLQRSCHRKSSRAQTRPCNAAAENQGPRPSPATQLPKTKGQDPALQRSCLKPRATPLQRSCRKPMPLPTSAQRQGQKMPALRAGLLRGRRPNLAPPAQRNRQKSRVGLQPYLLQLEPKMQCSAQAQLQSAITDSQLCSHVTRCAAAQIQFGIQSLRSAVATSDLPVSAPPHITDQICQLCAQSHSQSQITAQCSAHMS